MDKVFLSDRFPHLEQQFDRSLNLTFEFSHLFLTFPEKVFWNCPNGHTLYQTARSRSKGQCKGCSDDRARNFLEDRHPDLIEQFDLNLNAPTRPNRLYSRTNGIFWWRCAESGYQHSFESTVRARIAGRRCSYCTGSKILPGFNDWMTLYPDLADSLRWESDKNLDENGMPIEPHSLGLDNRELRHWTCLTGNHPRVISISSAIQGLRLGKRCRACAGFSAVLGETDVLSRFPELADRLDPTVHSKSDLEGLHLGSEKDFIWKCQEGHTWSRSIRQEVKINSCNKCSGREVWPGKTDLQTRFPKIAAEFASDLNLDSAGEQILPSEVHHGSNSVFSWRCNPYGHTWNTTVQKRTLDETKCPFCSDRRVWSGFNDLATKRPDLVREVDFAKHSDLDPRALLWVSHDAINWICDSGHKWVAPVHRRTSNGAHNPTGCPDCAEFGFKPNLPAYLYLLENTKLQALKVGITNTGTTRVEAWRKAGWEVLHLFEFEFGYQAKLVEGEFHRWRRYVANLPDYLNPSDVGRLGGWTETFNANSLDGEAVRERLQKMRNTLLA